MKYKVCPNCLIAGRVARKRTREFPPDSTWCQSCVAMGPVVTPTPRTDPFQDALIGESAAMRHLYAMMERIAAATATVLIEGATGTGKELIAQGLHRQSPRHDNPFLTLNCAGIPDALFESTLFGHRRGAFTDASRDQKGYLTAADSGTLFLDEIGDMPLGMQAKLLRVLQNGELTPIGDTKPQQVDVRMVAATNRPLWAEVEQKRFRSDLFFRLAVIELHAPLLRERDTDVELLSQHFLHDGAQRLHRSLPELSPDVRARFYSYDWPGNVRELRNEMERCLVLHDGDRPVELVDCSNRLRRAA